MSSVREGNAMSHAIGVVEIHCKHEPVCGGASCERCPEYGKAIRRAIIKMGGTVKEPVKGQRGAR